MGGVQADPRREAIFVVFKQAVNRTKVYPVPLFTWCWRPWKPRTLRGAEVHAPSEPL